MFAGHNSIHRNKQHHHNNINNNNSNNHNNAAFLPWMYPQSPAQFMYLPYSPHPHPSAVTPHGLPSSSPYPAASTNPNMNMNMNLPHMAINIDSLLLHLSKEFLRLQSLQNPSIDHQKEITKVDDEVKDRVGMGKILGNNGSSASITSSSSSPSSSLGANDSGKTGTGSGNGNSNGEWRDAVGGMAGGLGNGTGMTLGNGTGATLGGMSMGIGMASGMVGLGYGHTATGHGYGYGNNNSSHSLLPHHHLSSSTASSSQASSATASPSMSSKLASTRNHNSSIGSPVTPQIYLNDYLQKYEPLLSKATAFISHGLGHQGVTIIVDLSVALSSHLSKTIDTHNQGLEFFDRLDTSCERGIDVWEREWKGVGMRLGKSDIVEVKGKLEVVRRYAESVGLDVMVKSLKAIEKIAGKA
ncbi:hypothetical protein BKA69DRAFT_159696 [Paraphysoderma sedebokerense]|nr:hypothetical protein BKA69DRAFT_159696 [Paraphysoderma sedebokerense]